MKFVSGFIAAIIIALCGAALVIHGRWYDVAARGSQNPITAWVLRTTMVNSVRHQASGILPPDNLASRGAAGFQEFDEMCVQCHSAPGRERSAVGKGLRPDPPSLTNASEQWSPSEIFWIVKNGIDMTGMPAFGPTHDDQTIWNIVALVSSLKTVTPEQYQQMSSARGGTEHEHLEHSDEQHDHAEHHHH